MEQLRKTYCIQVEGVEVTSGADFFRGRSANVELCHCLFTLKSDPELAIYNLELISLNGGSIVSNVPGHSEAAVSIAENGSELLLYKISKKQVYIPDTVYTVTEVSE